MRGGGGGASLEVLQWVGSFVVHARKDTIYWAYRELLSLGCLCGLRRLRVSVKQCSWLGVLNSFGFGAGGESMKV